MGDGKKLKEILDSKGTNVRQIAKYESGRYSIRCATELTEIVGGQKIVRFYDPSGNLIEVRTPLC